MKDILRKLQEVKIEESGQDSITFQELDRLRQRANRRLSSRGDRTVEKHFSLRLYNDSFKGRNYWELEGTSQTIDGKLDTSIMIYPDDMEMIFRGDSLMANLVGDRTGIVIPIDRRKIKKAIEEYVEHVLEYI